MARWRLERLRAHALRLAYLANCGDPITLFLCGDNSWTVPLLNSRSLSSTLEVCQRSPYSHLRPLLQISSMNSRTVLLLNSRSLSSNCGDPITLFLCGDNSWTVPLFNSRSLSSTLRVCQRLPYSHLRPLLQISRFRATFWNVNRTEKNTFWTGSTRKVIWKSIYVHCINIYTFI
jgi:hypothetical protein